jgi:hypothetical protein
VKASLLIALVFIFAHLSSQKQLPLAHEDPGPLRVTDLPVEIGTDGTGTRAKSQIAAYCSVALSDQGLNQSCPVTPLSCEDYLAHKYRAAAELSTLNRESQAGSPFHQTRISCMESVAINSSTIELQRLQLSGSVCNGSLADKSPNCNLVTE